MPPAVSGSISVSYKVVSFDAAGTNESHYVAQRPERLGDSSVYF